MEQPVDTNYLVETPEGIDMQSELAGPVARTLAYAIDITIRTVILAVASIILAIAGTAGIGFILVISFLLEWFYPVLFEVFRQGQTPGKRAMGLAVVNEDLTPVRLGTSVIRNLLRFADFLPFAYLFGLTSMVISSKFQRLGDLAAGTLVIYRVATPLAHDLPKVTPIAPPISLNLEEQTAVINFTQRHQDISLERQQELAGILANVTAKDGEENVTYLRSVGNWLMGIR